MNERIYELATQAGAYCETYLHGGDPKPPILDNMDLEKFAELIVRKCVFISRTSANGFSAGDRMKEHFGVE